MKLPELVKFIEDFSSQLLVKEYNNETAFIAIDGLAHTFVSEEDCNYMLQVRCGFTDREKQTTFEMGPIIGLPEDFCSFNSIEARIYAILLANVALQSLDNLMEDSLDDEIKYVA